MTIEEARQKVGACWCHPTMRDKVMDPELALVFAEVLKEETDKAFNAGKDSQYHHPQHYWEI